MPAISDSIVLYDIVFHLSVTWHRFGENRKQPCHGFQLVDIIIIYFIYLNLFFRNLKAVFTVLKIILQSYILQSANRIDDSQPEPCGTLFLGTLIKTFKNMRTIQRMLYPTIAECKTMRCNFYPDMTAIYIVYKSILQKVRYKNSCTRKTPFSTTSV